MKRIFYTVSMCLTLATAHAQNVGIGITPQRAKFEVHGAGVNSSTTALFSGQGGGVSIQSYWPTIGFNQYHDGGGARYIADGYAAAQYLDPHHGGMYFDLYAPGTPNASAWVVRRALSIYNSGNVGIGTANFNASLAVPKNPGSDATISLNGSAHHSYFNHGPAENTYIRAGKNYGVVYINDVPGGTVAISGYVGINTGTPASSLEIRQLNRTGLVLVDPEQFNYWEIRTSPHTSPANLFLSNNGSLKGYFEGTNGNYNSVSDARLKKNVEDLTPVLDHVMQLRPVTYEMKDAPAQQQKTIGFIAQEVKKIFPDIVSTLPDTTSGYKDIKDLHAINYSSFGVLAIKAIQEQQKLILAQQVRIDELTKTVDGLSRQLYKKE